MTKGKWEERFDALIKRGTTFNDWLNENGVSPGMVKAFIRQVEKEAEKRVKANIGLLRQWLNEDRITDLNKMVTNEQLERWLLSSSKTNDKTK